MRAPENPSEITVEWLRGVLPRERRGCELVAVEVQPDFGRSSLLGKVARVRLAYASEECGPASVVVKFQANGSDSEARIYRLLSEEHISSVPKLLGAFEHGTILMEDLPESEPGSQVAGCTLRQARDVLSILAELHSSFWGSTRLPRQKPAQFAAIIRWNMRQCWDLFERRYREQLGAAMNDFEWLRRNSDEVSAHRLSKPWTLFHGDVHPENLMFHRHGEGKPVLLDWQLAGRGLAANDVSDFLVRGLSVELRRTNEELLLREYFDRLPRQAGYSFDLFMLDYRACLTRSMMSATMLVGPRFADRPDRSTLADIIASRVVAAVQDLGPADAFDAIRA